MKALGALVLTLAMVIAPSSAAAAAPSGTLRSVPGAPLADRDGNRISDGLQASLSNTQPSDRFDVVVNTTVARPGEFARAEVGAFEMHEEYTIIDGFHATMSKAQIENLSRSPRVIRIEENFDVHAMLDASQRDFGTAAAKTGFAVNGAGIGVCVVDTGADPNHEQLNGAKIAGWRDYVNNQPAPYDDHGHGTHVLSTAVGDGTGGSSAARFQGVAPGATAYVTKVLDSGGSGSDANVVSGVQWCASNPNVQVISMSVGTLEASDGQDAISRAVEAAVLTNGKVAVVAAGNSGDNTTTVGSPGAAEHAITVGSVAKYSAPSGYHTDGIYLSEFSSRGPTLDGRTKPDVAAPGERTVAAKAGTTATYVEMTGTSMATPFVAGTVALALDANPALTPAQVKSIVMGTAQDRGPSGVDDDWGAGLLDGYAVVAQASGASSYQPTAFPTWEHATGNVPSNGQWTYQFSVASADLNIPIAVTILIDGQLTCVSGYGPWCFQYAYSPDLDAQLIAPDGSVVAESTCPLNCGYYSVGHQETLAVAPSSAGTYTVRVYPFDGGGKISMDLSHGPLVSTGPPPPPANQPPVANNDVYSTASDTPLSVAAPGVLANDTDADGNSLTAALEAAPTNGTVTLNGNGSFTYTPNGGFSGSDSFTYVANDGQASSNIATVTITVTAPPPPPQPNVHIGDLDATATGTKSSWTAKVTITVHDETEATVPGATVSFAWGDGTAGSCTTDASGRCTASRTLRKRDASASLTITNVVGSNPYDSSKNSDPDGDSNGTTIVIVKP